MADTLLAQATTPATTQGSVARSQTEPRTEPGFWANPETWVTIAFLLFIVLFGRRLLKALTGMLDRRSQAVRAALEEAARLKAEAQAMLTEARARRDQAVAESQRLLEGARAEAERLSVAAAEEARAGAARRERTALERIAAAERAAVMEVRAAAVEIATTAADRVIRTGFGPEQDASLIDRAIAALPASLTRRSA